MCVLGSLGLRLSSLEKKNWGRGLSSSNSGALCILIGIALHGPLKTFLTLLLVTLTSKLLVINLFEISHVG